MPTKREDATPAEAMTPDELAQLRAEVADLKKQAQGNAEACASLQGEFHAIQGTMNDTLKQRADTEQGMASIVASFEALGEAARELTRALKDGAIVQKSEGSAAIPVANPPSGARSATPKVTVPSSARGAAPGPRTATRVAIPNGAVSKRPTQTAPQASSHPKVPGFARRTATPSLPPSSPAADQPSGGPEASPAAEALDTLKSAIQGALSTVDTLDPIKAAIARAKLEEWFGTLERL